MLKSRPQRASVDHIHKAGIWATYRDGTVNWWHAVRGGGVVVLRDKVDEISANGADGEKLLSNLFLKMLTEGAITTEAGNVFQYFTTLTEKADPLLWRWLVQWSTL